MRPILIVILLIVSSLFIVVGIIGVIVSSKPIVETRALSYIPHRTGNTETSQNFPPNSLKPREIDEFLNLHNEFREKNKKPLLKWDDYLARSAESYADKLLSEGCAIYHPKTKQDDELYLRNGQDGQNLSQFVYRGKPRKGLEVGTIRDAVQLWRNECSEYNPDSPTKGNVGHFSAMLWKNTKRIGCAYKKLTTKEKQASIYVCHYNKSGNWLTSDGKFSLFDKNVGRNLVCDK